MALSNEACKELSAMFVQMTEFLPAPMRHAAKVSQSFIQAGIMRDREKLEKQVLEPFHGWLHHHNVGVYTPEKTDEQLAAELEEAKKTVQAGIKKAVQ